MVSSLLASWNWTIDVIFVVLLIVGIWTGVQQGFISCVCKTAGTVFALIFAIIFCVSFSNFLESLFGMTTAIANGLTNSFSNEALLTPIPTDISGADVKSILEGLGVGWLPRTIIGSAFSSVETIPAGTTPAAMLGSTLAKWISIAISFVALFLIIKLVSVFLDKGLSGFVEKLSAFKFVNEILGGVFGLLRAAVVIFIVLAICSWLPIDPMHEFIANSAIVGPIFTSEWFNAATSYAISGQWFDDYIAQFLF